MPRNDISLLCTLYPASQQKQKKASSRFPRQTIACTHTAQKILDLLQKGARDYYRKPEAKCTTWSYFTPFPPPKTADAQLVIGGLEIYTEKQALQKQLDDPAFFQAYHETAKNESLYSRGEELVAWYLAAGFVAREEHARPFGGCLISLTKFVGDREAVLKAIEGFVPFVREKEPEVLTYAAFTRPKAPKEVMMFVRYKDSKALRAHSSAPEHDAVVEKLSQLIENDFDSATTLWKEIDDSFVSTQVGGPTSSSKL